MAGWGSFFSNAWRHSSVTVFHGKCTAPLTALRGFRCTSQRPRPVVNHSRKEASVWWYFLAHNTLRTPSCSHANVINSYNPMSVTYCKACIKLVVLLCIFFKTQNKKIAKKKICKDIFKSVPLCHSRTTRVVITKRDRTILQHLPDHPLHQHRHQRRQPLRLEVVLNRQQRPTQVVQSDDVDVRGGFVPARNEETGTSNNKMDRICTCQPRKVSTTKSTKVSVAVV